MKDTERSTSPDTVEVCEPRRGGKKYPHVVAIVVVLLVMAAAFIISGKVADIKSWGYIGVFVLSLLATASVILPVPGVAAVFVGGAFLNPFLVALVAGAAEPLGELTGYLAGYGGEAIVARTRLFNKLCLWMRKHGDVTIFLLSVVPNPIFDLGGIAAGAVGFPVWRFLLVAWVGKTIKSLGFALAGNMGMPWLLDIFQRFQ